MNSKDFTMLKFFLILILSLTFSFSNQKEHIKVCYLEWGKQGGKHLPNQGFNPDLFTHILTNAGYTSQIDIMPWKRCLLHVQKGSYDMVAGLWIDEKNKKTYEFFDPVTYDEISFMSLKNLDVNSGKLEEFKGKTIGILRGAGNMDMIKNGDFHVKILTDDDQMINQLKYGRVDAVVSNTAHLLGVIVDRFPELIGKTKVWKPALQTNISAPAISINHPNKTKLKSRFNKALQDAKENGLYEKLFKKHKLVLKYKKAEE